MKRLFFIILSCFSLLLSMTVFVSCLNSNEEEEVYEEDSGYDGTYYWEGFNSSHSVSIYGNHWSGTNVMYDQVSYESGRVDGDKIYDSSGYFVVARINGNSISWGNHTLRKEY